MRWILAGAMLFLRAVAALVVLPGTFGALIPAWIVSNDPHRGSGRVIGLVPLVLGGAILLWCMRDFYVAGKGTLAPWDPPRHLVAVGLYRFTRNPMYVGVLLLVGGWSAVAGSARLGAYTGLLAVAFHLRIIFYEERRLRVLFADEWVRYSAAVPRWLFRWQ